MQKVNWLSVRMISTVVLLLLFGSSIIGYSGYGMMQNNWGHSPFGWVGMFLMWLIPISLIALAVFAVGGIWLKRKARNATHPSPKLGMHPYHR